MKKISAFFKNITGELIIVFCYIFILNNYIGNVKQLIVADGVGYYEYLPSFFIAEDFVRKDKPIDSNPQFYERINKLDVYNTYKSFKVDKYPCGTALLQTPFFLCAYALSPKGVTGYEEKFHLFVFYASLFYLFLSLIFLKKLLNTYSINRYIIFFIQLLTVLATSVTIYTQFNGSYSHIYSLFTITAFLYFFRCFFREQKLSHLLWAAFFLGLIYNIRNMNILIVLFLPFIAGTWSDFIKSLKILFTYAKMLFLSTLIFIAVAGIFHLTLYLQTGSWFVYTYGEESFDFLHPYFYSILFSYKKGLFVYTPILFLASISTFWFIYTRRIYLFISWILFFVLITFLLSSWWSWYYGCSYGLRAYIDFYPVFFIPLAIVLNEISNKLRILLIGLSFLTIPVNIIQSYQYKVFILDWIDMNKQFYWEVFLKSDDRFIGLIAKRKREISEGNVTGELVLKEVKVPPSTSIDIFRIQTDEIKDFSKVTNIVMSFDSYFSKDNDARILTTIYGQTMVYFHRIPFITFTKDKLNTYQSGVYDYEIDSSKDDGKNILTVTVQAANDSVNITNVSLKFISKNK